MNGEEKNTEEDLNEEEEGKIEQLKDSLYEPDAPKVNKILKRDLSGAPTDPNEEELQNGWRSGGAGASSRLRGALE